MVANQSKQIAYVLLNILKLYISIPVDCKVDNWSAWGDCTVTCGGGTKTRARQVLQVSQHGGAMCPNLEETDVCNTDKCGGISFLLYQALVDKEQCTMYFDEIT